MSDQTPPAWAAAMRDEIGSMRAEVGSMRAEVGSVRAEMATRSNVADVMARIDRLQEDLTRQREGSVVELGTAEMAMRKNDTTRADVQTLTDMVLALTRQVRRMEADLIQLRGDGQA